MVVYRYCCGCCWWHEHERRQGLDSGHGAGYAHHRRDEQPAQPDGRTAVFARGVQGLYRHRGGVAVEKGEQCLRLY